jgi:hypothetical protein
MRGFCGCQSTPKIDNLNLIKEFEISKQAKGSCILLTSIAMSS